MLSSYSLGAPASLDPSSTPSIVANDRLRQAGMLVLALLLITTGSFIREKPREEQGVLDWVVLLQIGLSVAGSFLGLLLSRRHSLRGFGARVLTVYVLAALISGFFSLYLQQVVGYWLLLAGTSLLCMGLVSSSQTEASLRDVEKLILATVGFMLVKDTLIDAFYFRTQLDRMEELGIEMYRFGTGSTSSASMGLLAATAFWMSFKTSSERNASSTWWLFWKVSFATIVLLTRARVALFALIAGGVIRWWYRRRTLAVRSHAIFAAPCLAASVVLALAIAGLWKAPLVTSAVDFVNRGEDSETVMSVTGRTNIWPYAIQRIGDGPISIFFGHGHGVSKSVLNENNWRIDFYAYHAHNTFLEVLLSTGLAGCLPFVVLIVYSLAWLGRFSSLWAFSAGFRLRAASVVATVLTSTMTESELVAKAGPFFVVYIFYVLSLDRQKAFLPTRASHRI